MDFINKFDIALETINLKIAKEIKENKEKNYNIFKSKIEKLIDERNEIYKQNEEIIDKVINQYLKEVKGE